MDRRDSPAWAAMRISAIANRCCTSGGGGPNRSTNSARKVVQLRTVRHPGQPPVQVDLQPHVGHVGPRDVALAGQIDVDLDRRFRRQLLQPPHGLLQQIAVQLVADRGDVPALLGAEDVARPANLQVAHGDGEAGAHVAELLDRPQPPGGAGREVLVRVDQQVAVRAVLVAPHAAAKLVQIGQPVAVGLVDEDRVGVGNVQAALDDRRGQQHVVAAVDETEHHLFQLVLVHLAVADGQPGLGHDLPQPPGEDFDVLDAVVDEEDLPAAVQFAQHGVADQLGIEASHAGFDGQAVLRRRFQVRDVAQPQQAHVQRSRDGRGGHRQHVDRLPQRLRAAP